MDDFHILIADDEEELVQTLLERLQIRGIKATGVTSGKAAIEAVRNNVDAFAAVLLDVKMPRMSGISVMREIKKIKPALEVILITGHGSVKDAEEGISEGAFDYLMKPVDINRLLTILKSAAQKSGGSGE